MIQRNVLKRARATRFNNLQSSTSISPRNLFLPLRIPISSTSRAPALRCYSSAPQAKSEVDGEASSTETNQPDQPPAEVSEDPSTKEIEAKDKEILDLKDRYLRSVADFRNLQERTKREISVARDFAISRFAKDLIDSVDNLDRALSTVPAEKLGQEDSNKDLENLHSGLKMTEAILMQTLQKHGLERFDPSEKGERFDPNLHEATFQTKVEGKEDGTTFHTQQKGFTLNGRVIRAAKVGVVKNS
ncbi:Mitochondrial matrix cochaperone [Varicellaria rhodocarpa]|nr:Mitochondrial matrix cochaperone [Varicellaria rhodocarpa]